MIKSTYMPFENGNILQLVLLRGNPRDVRVTSGRKLCNNIIYIVLQTSVRLF